MDAAHNQMRKATEGQREGYRRSQVDSAVDEMFQPQGGYGGFGRSRETAWKETHEAAIARVQQFHLFSDEYGQPLKVGAWEDGKYAYLYLGNPGKGIIVPTPEKYLEYIPDADLSDVTPAELRAQLSVPMGSEAVSYTHLPPGGRTRCSGHPKASASPRRGHCPECWRLGGPWQGGSHSCPDLPQRGPWNGQRDILALCGAMLFWRPLAPKSKCLANAR